MPNTQSLCDRGHILNPMYYERLPIDYDEICESWIYHHQPILHYESVDARKRAEPTELEKLVETYAVGLDIYNGSEFAVFTDHIVFKAQGEGLMHYAKIFGSGTWVQYSMDSGDGADEPTVQTRGEISVSLIAAILKYLNVHGGEDLSSLAESLKSPL